MQPTSETPRSPDASAAASAQPDAGPATGAAPRTAQELAGLRRLRDDIVQQLTATHARRSELAGELESTDPGARGVLKQQMAELDHRVLRLETAVTNLDRAIASAPPAVAAAQAGSPSVFQQLTPPHGFVLVSPNGPSATAVPVLLLFLIALQVFGFLRRRARRLPPAAANDVVLRDAAARLARLEQAVDAIAVEVERVSEGQRFVSRLLGEQQAARAARLTPAREHTTPV